MGIMNWKTKTTNGKTLEQEYEEKIQSHWKELEKKYRGLTTSAPIWSSTDLTTTTVEPYYSTLTKFRMKDGAKLMVETNEGWIEVDGLRISMEVLRSVAKKINEEKAEEQWKDDVGVT
jgi:hypothetical protein